MKSILENFNFDTVPKHNINVGLLSSPSEIGQYFAHYDIKHYLYSIIFNLVPIKFGKSWESSHYRGERVYSQIGQLSSWNQNLIRGHGAEFLHVAAAYKELYGQELTHHDMTVQVWDFTNHSFGSYIPHMELEQYETELMRRYLALTGVLPVGNIQYRPSILTRMLPQKAHFENFFEE